MPPLFVKIMNPSSASGADSLVMAALSERGSVGSVIVMFSMAISPIASVTVTDCTPAVTHEAVAVVSPFDQIKV